MSQRIEDFVALRGKTVTLSSRVRTNDSGVKIRLYDGISSPESGTHTGGGDWETLSLTATVDNSATGLLASIYTYTSTLNDYIEFEWIKLEEGSVATPWTVPDPAIEETRCKRYGYEATSSEAYSNIGSGTATSTTSCQITVAIPPWMRTKPALSSSGNFRLLGKAWSASFVVTGLSLAANFDTNGSVVLVSSVASGLTAGDIYHLQASNDTTASAFFSAEL